uniref:Protoheme IX farnesyltransferase, mitochondrial isoform X2 n=1 Tax=Pogona vitticeps TaxID=103695 RepID=A0ABM5FM84_9SAUR
MQQVPCKFILFLRVTKEKRITFQKLNFLKQRYVTDHSKGLFQQAKLKPESVTPPCFEGQPESAAPPCCERQHSVQEEIVGHVVPSVSPLLPPVSDKPTVNESKVWTSTAITDSTDIVVRPASKEEKQWKEMKIELDSLPGILARLSKIKLTALVVSTASAGFAMAPVPFDVTCFLLASLGTGLASCAANIINQSSPCRFLCHLLCSSRNSPTDLWSKSSYWSPGSLQHYLVHMLLHPTEENQHHQYMGGSSGWCHSPDHGMDSSNWQSGSRSLAAGRDSLLLAVPPFQCSKLGPSRRLLPRWLLHDVCHSPSNVQTGSSASLLCLNWTFLIGSHHGCHHMDFPCNFFSSQLVYFLPGLSFLQRR